jgi:hypothetical protein
MTTPQAYQSYRKPITLIDLFIEPLPLPFPTSDRLGWQAHKWKRFICRGGPAGYDWRKGSSRWLVMGGQARGLKGSVIWLPVSIHTVLTSVYSSMAWKPFSRPRPLSLNPPNGAT